MPRYYFDVYEDGRVTCDVFGLELCNADEARDQAVALLPDMARQQFPTYDRQRFAVIARDRLGQPVYRASMTFSGHWAVAAQPGACADVDAGVIALEVAC